MFDSIIVLKAVTQRRKGCAKKSKRLCVSVPKFRDALLFFWFPLVRVRLYSQIGSTVKLLFLSIEKTFYQALQ